MIRLSKLVAHHGLMQNLVIVSQESKNFTAVVGQNHGFQTVKPLRLIKKNYSTVGANQMD